MLKDAEAALRARDQKWFTETGCLEARSGSPVVLIEAPLGRTHTRIWRGRVSGETFYFSEFSVGNMARSGPLKDRKEAEKVFLSMPSKFYKENPTLKGKTEISHRFATNQENKIHLLIGPSSYWLLELFCESARESGKLSTSPCEVPRPLM
jgi:hypothetical protein